MEMTNQATYIGFTNTYHMEGAIHGHHTSPFSELTHAVILAGSVQCALRVTWLMDSCSKVQQTLVYTININFIYGTYLFHNF